MVAVWVHDMGDFKKVTVSASAMDPNEYAVRYWGDGRLVWLREVADKTEGLALQKAIMSAGVAFEPENEKLTSKTCFTGEVDFDSVKVEILLEKESWVYLKESGEHYTVHCTSKPPREALWCVRFDLGGARFKDKVLSRSENIKSNVVKNLVPLNELLENETDYEICPISSGYGVYLKKVADHYKCATADFPGEPVWHAKISTLDKAKEFSKFIHYNLSSKRSYVNGQKCFVPKGPVDLEYCVAKYKEWVAAGRPGLSSAGPEPVFVDL